ncbi:putative transcription factor bHLH107 [Impatiens glandulifera]|uniref:putative transcription factor bHLH107 n=1 Tax=Impatiens glandulifera TaxID=253017 RepID=UPI001FB13620|nr:putative transcription factor bHLH107 [Impatiens glandulifera]
MEMGDDEGAIWSYSLGSMKSSKKMSKQEAMTKHAISEKIRRIRLKQRFKDILRLFPNIHKRDKASILKEAVCRLNALKNTTANILDNVGSSKSTFLQFLPNEENEAIVVTGKSSGHDIMAKVTISCNQRPSLNRELTQAIKVAGGKQVGVEMATVGGRTKVVALVKWMDSGGNNLNHQIMSLKRAVRVLSFNLLIEEQFYGR